jgi:hypothetical protein
MIWSDLASTSLANTTSRSIADASFHLLLEGLCRGNVGYIVMCFLLISMLPGILVVTDEIAILAAGSHVHVAAMLAVVSIFGNVGGAIGRTIASSVWSDVLPNRPRQYVAAEDLLSLHKICDAMGKQLPIPLIRRRLSQSSMRVKTRCLGSYSSVLLSGLLVLSAC